MKFELDPRLAQDGIKLGETDDYLVNMANDQRYPWVILIPKVANISEVYELSNEQQADLWRSSTLLGKELMKTFAGDKLNTAAIGNIVKQLHIHHVVRFENDASWPQPIWGRGDAIAFCDERLQERTALLRQSLSLLS